MHAGSVLRNSFQSYDKALRSLFKLIITLLLYLKNHIFRGSKILKKKVSFQVCFFFSPPNVGKTGEWEVFEITINGAFNLKVNSSVEQLI